MNISKILGINVYDYGGEGEPVIFIHSFPLSSRMWNRQTDYFADKYRVITYDLRGLGFSVSDDNLFSMEKLVNDIFHIMNSLKILQAHVCGLSMGGYIALRAVLKDQERFKSITVVNTKSGKDDDDELLRRSNAIIKIKSGGRKTFTDKITKKLFGNNNEISENIIKTVEDIINWNSDDGICGCLLALSTRINVGEKMHEIKIPSLVIAGEFDSITPLSESVKTAEIIEGSEFKIIENAGHLCNMEKPDEFNKILERFLKNNQKLNLGSTLKKD